MRVFTEGFEMGDTLFMDAGYCSAQTTGRSGVYYLQIGPTYTGAWAWGRKNLPSALSEFYFRYAMYSIPNGNSVTFQTGTGGASQLTISITSSTTMDVSIGGAAAVTYNLPFTIGSNWYLYEVYYKLADSGGRYTIKIEGLIVADFTGDTKPGADTTVGSIQFGCGSVSNSAAFDDLALNDTSNADGLGDTGWCGDGHVIALKPNGNGDTNQWTGSDGNSTDNYLLVDETPANADTDYVEDGTAGHQDMYNVEDWDDSGNKTVLRVWAEARAKDTVADGGQIKVGVKTHGTVYLSPAITQTTSYAINSKGDDLKVNPNTSSPWTNAEMDAVQFVVEVE